MSSVCSAYSTDYRLTILQLNMRSKKVSLSEYTMNKSTNTRKLWSQSGQSSITIAMYIQSALYNGKKGAWNSHLMAPTACRRLGMCTAKLRTLIQMLIMEQLMNSSQKWRHTLGFEVSDTSVQDSILVYLFPPTGSVVYIGTSDSQNAGTNSSGCGERSNPCLTIN